MKKILGTMISLILLLSFAYVSSGAEIADDVWVLYEYWETKGYPDDVGGVYYDAASNGLVIILVDADEVRKAEILSMVKSTDGLSFGESKYSYNEMRAVQNEIIQDMSDSNGKIYSVGVGWKTTEDEIGGFGESGKEFRVVVTVDKSVFDTYVSTYENRYGDMVYVEVGEAPMLLQDTIATDHSNPVNSASKWLLPAMIIFLLAAGIVFLLRRRR